MEEPSNKNEIPTQPKRKKRYPLWLLGLLILCFGSFIFLLFSPERSKAKEQVLSQLEAIKNKNTTEAYYAYTSREFQKKYPLSAFNQIIKSHPLISAPVNVKINKIEEEGRHSAVEVSLEDANGLELILHFLLSKDDADEWKISEWSIDRLSGSLFDERSAHGVKKAFLSYLDDLAKGDFDKAYYDHSTKSLRDAATLEQFRNLTRVYPELKNQGQLKLKEILMHEGQATIETETNSQRKIKILFELLLTKEGWEVDNIHLIDPIAENEKVTLEPKALQYPVRKHLQLLKSGEPNKAYELLANGFKFATTADEFALFIRAYPFLAKHNLISLQEYFDGNVGKIRTEMKEGKATHIVDYTLAKEDGDWKIWGFEVVDQNQNSNEIFNWKPLLEVIQGQKQAIISKSFNKAYSEYTSSLFQKATSYGEFVDFIKAHPIFSAAKKSKVVSLSFENNEAVIREELISENNDKVVVEYHLAKENGLWKILTLKTLEENEVGGERPLQFSSFTFSKEPPSDGRIKNAEMPLLRDQPVYGLLAVKNGKPGERIEIRIKHIESRAPSRLFSFSLTNSGDLNLPLIFTSPSGIWPTGHYTVEVSASGKEKESFAFQI